MVLRSGDAKNLSEWIAFFKALGPRVELIERTDPRLPEFFREAEKVFRERHTIEPENTLIDWPPGSKTFAFAVRYDESNVLENGPKFDPENLYVFCLGNRAYTVGYHEWDGDAEEDNWATTYSIQPFGPSALHWNYVTTLIVDRLEKAVHGNIPSLR